jgi:Flp pilus assembly protein TadD/predicted small secreted protein
MRQGTARALIVAVAAFALAACNTTGELAGQSASQSSEATEASAMASANDTQPVAPATSEGLLGSDPNDDLGLGKKMYRANNFGLAEKHFRRAVELHPRDAEAWLGLAASYDRLRRFDLADRAYAEATRIVGPTVEILNNEGFSYMLRGDYKRARAKLVAADRKDPGNKFVANNMRLLDDSIAQGKQVE